MKWDDNKKGTWTSGKFSIRLGSNNAAKAGVSVPAKLSDVYHCYNDGKYIAQCNTLDDAKAACEKLNSPVTK